MLFLDDTRGLDLAQSLGCGQCFRWQRCTDGWLGIVGSRAVTACQQADGRLLLTGLGGYEPSADKAFWRQYFALDVDYALLQQRIAAINPALATCLAAAPGIRVLRQPFWETLVTFLISQNNNIPRIQSIVDRLCARLGQPLGCGLYSFPAASVLACLSTEALAFLRAGWRAAYLADAAQKVASGEITPEKLAGLSTAEARHLLQQIRGVGPKVANCTLLFGLSRWDAYPVDVWMKRADTALFTCRVKDVGAYLNRRTGGYAGIAQQYIFAWARAGGLEQW